LDSFELEDRMDNLELQVGQISAKLSSFISDFDTRLQEHLLSSLEVISADSNGPDVLKDKGDYIIKLICSIGYVQSCILENQRKILELLGDRNIRIKTMSEEDKRRRIERVLNEVQDPFKSNKKKGK